MLRDEIEGAGEDEGDGGFRDWTADGVGGDSEDDSVFGEGVCVDEVVADTPAGDDRGAL